MKKFEGALRDLAKSHGLILQRCRRGGHFELRDPIDGHRVTGAASTPADVDTAIKAIERQIRRSVARAGPAQQDDERGDQDGRRPVPHD